MTKAELVSQLADATEITKSQAGLVLDSLAKTITDSLKQDEKITLPGVGIFSVGHRAAREGRNPQTGASLQIAAAKTVKFKVAKAIKDILND